MWTVTLQLVLLLMVLVSGTQIHEPGYCSLYGQCGKKSLFGKELPCEANIPAVQPTEAEAELLAEVCGWTNVDLACCNEVQLVTLKEQLQKATPIIASCPACKHNFYQFFCHFTCSPDQLTFLNVTETGKSISGDTVVTQLDDYVFSEYASDFYDSCKNIKFSLTNGYAMDLIGGGAKNYQQFLKFLGDEKPLLGGSPFQINYKFDNSGTDMALLNDTAYGCDDPVYRCACPDCHDACPEIPQIATAGRCHVGTLPCFSFSVILVYSVLLVGACLVTYFKNKKSQSPLFVESLHEDGEDDDDDSILDLDLNSPTTYLLNDALEKQFSKLGFYCAYYPKTVIFTSLIIAGILSSLMVNIQIERNPVNLWVSSSSEPYRQKIHFDENFGPFYRSQQIFLVNETGPILNNYDTLHWWFERELEIRSIVVDDDLNNTVALPDLCFKPTGDACIIESFTQYFHGDFNAFPTPDKYLSKLKSCIDSPVTCLPDFQQPLNKNLLFGGFEDPDQALNATAIVVTILLNNDVDEGSDQFKNAQRWENLLEEYLVQLRHDVSVEFPDLKISFNTESSLEKELNKSTNTDLRIVIISYLVMFAYASLALGGTVPGFTLVSWTRTKFSLGLIGIFIVLLSVASSLGLCALMGIKSTLIIAEVIPFLVLAVGVDNIFLITNEFKKYSNELPLNLLTEQKVGITLGKIGPSILLSSSSQVLCFSLASAVSMPAVRNFAIYCAGAVFINAILQLTCFVSILSLDEKRYRDNRLDILPFVKLDSSSTHFLHENNIIPQLMKDDETENHFFHRLMKKYYSPFVLNKKIKPMIIGCFILWFGVSLTLLPEISLGLDQRIAIPSDSFLIDYFNDIYEYLNVGPPIYFVVDNLNLTVTENQQKICGRFAGCNQYSLGNILEQEYNKENGIIADPLSSWLDDFFLWLNPDMDQCCRVKKLNPEEFCLPNAPARPCQPCYQDKEYDYSNITSFPHGTEFLTYFSNWIESPSDPCPLGGKAPYSTSIKPDYDDNSISSSVFRTSHLPLRSQNDFITAYKDSLNLVEMMKQLIGLDQLYAYSPFYIFFMQYDTITKLTFSLISVALALVFVLASILLGSIRVAAILIIVVMSILVDIGGFMAIWGISLNAVSLVNLIICVGLAVEFCVHIARGYMFIDRHIEFVSVRKDSQRRAYQSLINIGGSVFGGITMTKLIGVMVLAFTHSKIFEVYYFRMWLSLIIVLSLHSLMLLPVVLSYIGGGGYLLRQEGEFVGDDLLSRLRSSYEDED